MTAVNGTLWSIFAAGLFVPAYSLFQKTSYERAAKQGQPSLKQKQNKFRVSFFGYMPSLIFIIFGWCGVWQGIVRSAHSEPRCQAFIITGLILAFFGNGVSKGLYNSYILLNENFLEYKYGRSDTRIHLGEITCVQLVTFRLSNYILVVTRKKESLKIPLYFRGGPQLYAFLLARHKK